MSDPSDDTNGASSSASRARASGGMGGAKGDLARLRSARASSGVNRAEVKTLDDIYESHTADEYQMMQVKERNIDNFVEDDDGDYTKEDDVIWDDEQAQTTKKGGKKASAAKGKKSAASIEAAAKRKKKQEAENPTNSRLEAKAPVNTIMQSFAKVSVGKKKVTSAPKDDMDDLLDTDLLADDEDIKPVKPAKKASSTAKKTPPKTSKPKSPPKAKQSAVKIELGEKTEMEVDEPVSVPSASAASVEMMEVSEMTENDEAAAAMVAEMERSMNEDDKVTKRKAAIAAALSPYLGGVDMSIVDESVMVVDENSHEYLGSDWTKIEAEVARQSAAGENESSDRSQRVGLVSDFTPLLDDKGSLLVYWMDAYEDVYARPGTVFVFGYVWNNSNNTCHSICISVQNIQRVLHFFPKPGCTTDEVHQEFNDLRKTMGIKSYLHKTVKKQYTFDVDAVPRGTHDFLEVLYPYSDDAFSQKTEGKTYAHVFGTTRTALETLILDARLMGPGWVVIKNPTVNKAPMTWCEYECTLEDMDNLVPARFPASEGSNANLNSTTSNNGPSSMPGQEPMNTSTTSNVSSMAGANANTTFRMPPTPKLKLLSLKVKVLHDLNTKQNEILAISGIEKFGFDVENATAIETIHASSFRYWTIMRKVVGIEQPIGMDQMLKNNTGLQWELSEKALLNNLMAKIGKYDPDVLLGHGLASFDLDVLLHRMAHHKIPTWSKLGRLRKTTMPRLKAMGEGDASFAERQASAGRLICDTYTAASEFLRSQKNYKLKTLAAVHLDSKPTPELTQRDIVDMMTKVEGIKSLAAHVLNDAYLALQLVAKMDALPLTKQLTELGGNLWSRSLTGARAERIEYLLMHRFYNLPAPGDANQIGYIIPDKAKVDGDGKRKKNPAYQGGYVIQPQSGLYEQFTLLLDFNSLYPSLIQEYNVCFTTIERSRKTTGEWNTSEPPSTHIARGILPATIRELVDKRKQVKQLLAAVKDDPTKTKQLDMRQLAIKLVANSMYGCLGFKSSRFCAIPMAELITRKGREALMRAKEIATEMGLHVIYGDTDSIMINTNTTDYQEVLNIGTKLKKSINKKFNELEIDIDGIFKSLLLLQKKKYAAMLVMKRNPDQTLEVTRQEKGLDLVRRDWCNLASSVGRSILECIFDEKHIREAEGIHAAEGIQEILRQRASDVREGRVPIEEFAITKSMTKRPEDYPDAHTQPHVQVALALRREGLPVMVGEMIQYVICRLDQAASSTQTGAKAAHGSIADRARHPDHVKRDHLTIDVEWYLTHQVHPSAARLCEHIEGLNASVIAACLGLDANAFKAQSGPTQAELLHLPSAAQMSLETRFADCAPLKVKCAKCGHHWDFRGMLAARTPTESEENAALGNPLNARVQALFKGLCCPQEACQAPLDDTYLKNILTLFIRRCQTSSYHAELECQECGERTHQRILYARDGRPLCRQCLEPLHSSFSPKDLYTQFQFLKYLFDVHHALTRLGVDDSEKPSFLASPLYGLNSELSHIVSRALEQNKSAIIPCEAIFSCFSIPLGQAQSASISADTEFLENE
jgi:DNA polymerase alpha subunit A